MKFTALAFTGITLLLPLAALAQGDFRVGNETGLELPSSAAKADKREKVSPVAEKKATEITCTGETLFDGKAATAVFIKDVKIVDPQFTLTADKLTAYLKKPSKTPAVPAIPGAGTPTPEPTATATPAPKAPAQGKAESGGASGLEKAVAEGHVVIIQERTDDKGEVVRYIGRATKAEYVAEKGEMTLSGWPQIQQGFNNQVATEESTVMVMDRDGHLHTKGSSMTVIKSDSKPELSKKP